MLTFYSTRSPDILSWKKFIERVESSKIQKWHSLDSLEFSLLCFERVPSTRRVFLKEHCNFYASTENVLPYCVQHKCCAWIWHQPPGDPSKKLNPEHLEYDYERLNFFFEKLKLIKRFWLWIPIFIFMTIKSYEIFIKQRFMRNPHEVFTAKTRISFV